jgi:uncharacterized protein YcbK (DUF882 family)
VSQRLTQLNVSPHLSMAELACHDAARTPYPQKWIKSRALALAKEFEEIRSLCGGKPITVLSAYRTPEYNRQIGGAALSQHVQGRALDLSKARVGVEKLWNVSKAVARERGVIRGLGRYPWGVHIDTRPSSRLVVWTTGTRPAAEVFTS